MTKLSTQIDIKPFLHPISLNDKVMILGSCFADEIGSRMLDAGFDICLNPFGTLYNPISITNSVARLSHGVHFRQEECQQMGAGAGLVCSWWHHTSFARANEEDFLKNANKALDEASAFWKSCNKVIISLGTAMVWKLVSSGEVVSNCLKRPSAEFSHEMLGVEQITAVLRRLAGSNPDKEFIFTVSPIRHLGDGAHTNTLSKATLQLALEDITKSCSNVVYFPAYEILLDELRDYRFYAEDLVHPSKTAADIIWERFMQTAIDPADFKEIAENQKKARAARHRQLR